VAPTPTFSIIIPTYEASRHIERLLRSIRIQSGPSYTVTVVDQSSSDGTADIARAFGCTVLTSAKPRFYSPPALSRNMGAASSQGRILLHLDADMEFGSPDFLQRLEIMFDDEHRAVIIHEQDVASGFLARCKAVERSCYHGSNMEYARAATRELFCEVGGYDEAVSAGEDLFITSSYRRRTQIGSDDSLFLYHHLGQYSLKALLKKKFSYGRTANTYLRRARALGGVSASRIVWYSVRAYLKNWRMLRQHPILYLSVFPLRTVEFVAVRLGMLLGPPNGALRRSKSSELGRP
jgi:glycosyltransferase involved in cell wall biosynthesis